MDEYGCWVVYYSDRSGIAMFPTEIEALRVAVNRQMECKFVEWGVDPFDGNRMEADRVPGHPEPRRPARRVRRPPAPPTALLTVPSCSSPTWTLALEEAVDAVPEGTDG